MPSTPKIPQANKSRLTPADTALAVFVALLLFGIYMFTFDGTIHSTDGLSMFAVAENLLKHGNLDVRQLENWEDSVALGLDGKPYINDPPGPILFIAPFLALALVLPQLGLSQTTMILMPLSSALAAIYLYLSTQRLGYPRRIGVVVTLLAGLATMTWLRTRDLVTDPLMVFSFAATFYYALAYRQDKKLGQAGLVGLALAITILHKTVNGLAIPFFFWYLAVPDFNLFKWRQIDWRAISVATLPVAGSLLMTAGYNVVRFGSPLDSGFRGHISFSTPFWIGFTGLIISPYKSLFLYVPIFILIPLTIRKMWQSHPRELILILGLLISNMVVFGAWHDWGGGRNWGPRYLAPLNGLVTLLLLPLIQQAFQPNQWRDRIILITFSLISLSMQILGISARDNAFLDVADYWTPPPNLSFWGELSWNKPDEWPIWGHILRFDLSSLPVIWHWRWAGINHFDLPALLAALLIIAMGLGGLIVCYRRERIARLWLPLTAWLVAAVCVALILTRNYDDPRSIKDVNKAAQLWPAYSTLMRQLPHLVKPGDAIIFTDRRLEFYLLNTDKTFAQRYFVTKPNRPRILETVPKLLQEQAEHGRLWLVSDDLNNRQLAYATELWLKERGRPTKHYLFGSSVQLTAFEPYSSATWDAIPPEPQLAGLVEPDDYTFNGIASLLGWNWPDQEQHTPPVSMQAGQAYHFELYWIYHGKAPHDLFFVRLLDETGQTALEVLTTPRPASRLIPGQLLIEDAVMALPADLPAGAYHLQIGFYIPVVETGELVFPLPAEMTEIRIRSQLKS